MELKPWNIWFAEQNRVLLCSKCVLVNDAKEVLIVNTSYKGWDIPGGMLDTGESAEVGLIREIKEELSVQLEKISLKVIGTFTKHVEGISQEYLYFYFTSKITESQISNIRTDNTEIIEFKFVNIKDIGLYVKPNVLQLAKATYLAAGTTIPIFLKV